MPKERQEWTVFIENRVNSAPNWDEEMDFWNKPSIYRVPTFARRLSEKAFTPHVASFGPFHHGKDHLIPMEEHKLRAVVHFLKRARRPIADFVNAVEGVLPQLQDSYSGLDGEWREDRREEFLQLMIVDGCFMLEVLRVTVNKEYYAPNDPFFSHHGEIHIMPYIQRDMLMIENQLPLQLLKTLISVESVRHHMVDEDINKMVLGFCAPESKAQITRLGLHPLDIFRQSLVQVRGQQHPGTGSIQCRCAVELRESGVRFKKSNSTSLTDIHFKDGVLSLPSLAVDDATECIFLNLVAFEHLHVGAGNDVGAYLSFMDEIIDTEKDVALLQRKKIINNGLGSNKAVAELFNVIGKEITLEPPHSGIGGDVRQLLNEYCEKSWNEHCAYLKHNYLRNLWTILALAGAIIVLILTFLQALYAILDYYKK